MASRELRVEIIGDSRSLERALGKAGNSATGFGSKFAKAGKMVGVAALGMGAAVGAGLFVTLKRGFEELADSQKVMAQTEAVIKSTGAAANVTKGQVEGYAASLSKMSGVDDEAIQSGENMLLTFKNIRNEVGAGNDIFKQSTATLLDMSTALGTDMNKSAIQLGKALNDPIKGLTALTRVGVTFDAGQKKMIEGMVKAGDTMGAQKIILEELNSEFGGSAAAFGETMPGQLAKLKNAFDEVAGEMATKFLPVLTSLVEWINAHWPQISAVFDAVGTAITASFQAIGVTVNWLREQWEIHRESAIKAWTAVQTAVMRFIDFFQTQVVPAIQSVVNMARAVWDHFGGEITAIGGRLVATVKQTFLNMVAPIRIILALLKGDWTEAWNVLKQVVTGTLGALAGNIKAAGGAIVSAAIDLGREIVSGIVSGLKDLGGKVTAKLLGLLGVISSAAQAVYNYALSIGTSIISGIVDGLAGLVSAVKNKIVDGVKSAVDLAGRALPGSGPWHFTIHEIGEPLVEGTILGVKGMKKQLAAALGITVEEAVSHAKQIAAYAKEVGWATALAAANGLKQQTPSFIQEMRNFTQAGIDAAKAKIEEAKGQLSSAMASMASAALAAFDAVTNAWKSPMEKLLEKLRLDDAKKAVKKAVTDAQAELNKLIAESSAASQARQALGSEPPPGMDPEEWKKQVDAAQAVIDSNGPQILEAQQRLADALHAQDIFNKEQQAARERAEYLAKRERDRRNFSDQLADLEKWAIAHKGQHAALLDKIRQLWRKFGVDARTLGQDWGQSLVDGMYDSIPDILDAAKAVANAMKGIDPGPRPKPKARSGGPAGDRGGAMGGALVVNVYNAGSVLSERDLVASIRNAVIQEGRRSGGNLMGGYG